LKSSNEEYLSVNEELQSTNEELETDPGNVRLGAERREIGPSVHAQVQPVSEIADLDNR
jgi:hypothetical protein